MLFVLIIKWWDVCILLSGHGGESWQKFPNQNCKKNRREREGIESWHIIGVVMGVIVVALLVMLFVLFLKRRAVYLYMERWGTGRVAKGGGYFWLFLCIILETVQCLDFIEKGKGSLKMAAWELLWWFLGLFLLMFLKSLLGKEANWRLGLGRE